MIQDNSAMTQNRKNNENGTVERGPIFTVMSSVELDQLPEDHSRREGIDNSAFEMELRRNPQSSNRRMDSTPSASHGQTNIVRSKICCCIRIEKVFVSFI